MKLQAKYLEDVNRDEFSIFFTNLPDVVICLVDENDEDIAFADAFNLSDIDEFEDAEWIEIHNLGVKVEGNGYGSTLVQMLQEKMSFLEAHDVLPEAQGFWAKMNFSDNGEYYEWS